ncbi:hypothetical protein [Sodalis glossinidius]|uniref:hypothetical protein n=1 Tax=Sodalis glossinidius TaxID=63612 RepID=UPI0002EB6CBA|nr:hypothetical protein [Sodalis glossinidius]
MYSEPVMTVKTEAAMKVNMPLASDEGIYSDLPDGDNMRDTTSLTAQTGESSAADKLTPASALDDPFTAAASAAQKSYSASLVSQAVSQAGDGQRAEVMSLRRDSGPASVVSLDWSSASGDLRYRVVGATSTTSLADGSPIALNNVGDASEVERVYAGRRESVISADLSVSGISDRRTSSEGSVALSAISASSPLVSYDEEGNALFLSVPPEVENEASAGKDAAGQSRSMGAGNNRGTSSQSHARNDSALPSRIGDASDSGDPSLVSDDINGDPPQPVSAKRDGADRSPVNEADRRGIRRSSPSPISKR